MKQELERCVPIRTNDAAPPKGESRATNWLGVLPLLVWLALPVGPMAGSQESLFKETGAAGECLIKPVLCVLAQQQPVGSLPGEKGAHPTSDEAD